MLSFGVSSMVLLVFLVFPMVFVGPAGLGLSCPLSRPVDTYPKGMRLPKPARERQGCAWGVWLMVAQMDGNFRATCLIHYQLVKGISDVLYRATR